MQKCFRAVALRHRFPDAKAHLFGEPLHPGCRVFFFVRLLYVNHRINNLHMPMVRMCPRAYACIRENLTRNIESNQSLEFRESPEGGRGIDHLLSSVRLAGGASSFGKRRSIFVVHRPQDSQKFAERVCG